MPESYQNSYQNQGSDTATKDLLIASKRKTGERKRKGKLSKTLLLVCILFLFISIGSGIYIVKKKNESATKKAKMSAKQKSSLNSRETTAESGCESTIVLMRHCEKMGETKDSDGDEHCSLPGLLRAQFLPSVFTDVDSRWPTPSSLYALSKTRPGVHHLNYREIETLNPLAIATNLTIDTRFTTGEGEYLADELFDQLSSGSLCGKSTLICWKHTDIPDMARALGCGAKVGCPKSFPSNDFDQVWLITFTYDADFVYQDLLKNDNDNEEEEVGSGRFLRNKKRTREWSIFGFVTQFGFDPLHSQKLKGFY
mmetsp:Transcript_15119/g.23215  ORF Transcript_15119/g.23215 Transcript_15119/m.23215 type:complete len:311 (-) Transcript_15119:153-1085(-)|eukprot:CAMPEP_0194257086 /NCGR_PEP_ID=MMETSP0158-20130606/38220_1 /TAXON_ID=33649 /ORGANISM="Thalassionema nitzschioides, Strain L26-B" /LENGTH=310 /DNA_ID=CAMNT_0038996019 /DNA_START=44 /DNA_END=976 /DNA_ORIENTATION=+